MNPIISVEGLGKSYTIRHEGQTRYKSLREEIFRLPKRLLNRDGQSKEEFWALKDVNFDIMPGERVGIIGRNGAGKSTLLKLLSRITEPTTGRITLRGRVASLLEVGTGFHPELTGRENIFLNGAILGMSRAEVRRKFDEIVDFAGVEKFLDTPVKRYSSGMYVRLAFAVAAHLEPEILIVDEVLAVGDAEFQKKCLGKMEDVGREGRTVLFVSHNMGAVQSICNKSILFDAGLLKFIGSTHEALRVYKNIKSVPIVRGKYIKSLKMYKGNVEETSFTTFPEKIEVVFNVPVTLNNGSYFLISINSFFGRAALIDSREFSMQGNSSVQRILMDFLPMYALAADSYSLNFALFINNDLVEHIPDILTMEIGNSHVRERVMTDIVLCPQLNEIEENV